MSKNGSNTINLQSPTNPSTRQLPSPQPILALSPTPSRRQMEINDNNVEGHIVTPSLVRQSTRLESLGRTVRAYIPQSLSSFSALSLSPPSSADRPPAPGSTSPKSTRPVSFGHYSLSDPQVPRFGQLSNGISPVDKHDVLWGRWQHVRGRQLLLLGYTDGIQVWDATNLDAVRELVHLPSTGRISSATILSRTSHHDNEHTVLLMIIGSSQNAQLHVYSLASHSTLQRHPIPHATSVQASDSLIVVSTTYPLPALHIYASSAQDFPLIHTLTIPHILNPVFALSGRLLAYSSPTPPSAPDGDKYNYSTSTSRPLSTSAIMDTARKGAVDIGSGVWSGVKALGGMALEAAGRGSASDGGDRAGFSKSAPSTASPLGMLGVRKRLSGVFGGGVPSIDERGYIQTEKGTLFVTVVDLLPLTVSNTTTALPAKVAEFRWMKSSRTISSQPVSTLSWNPNATQLAVSGVDGLLTRIFAIRPRPTTLGAVTSSEKEMSNAAETVWHVYDLVRGATKADIGDLVWEKDGRWAGFPSSNGTIHVFATNPFGGIPEPHLHLETRMRNAVELQPLGTSLRSNVRLRATPTTDSAPSTVSATAPGTILEKQPLANFIFLTNSHSLSSMILPNPLRPSTSASHYRRASASSTPVGSLTSSPRMHAHGIAPSPTRSSHNVSQKQAFQDILHFDVKEATLTLSRIATRLAERPDTTPGSTNLSVSASSGSNNGTLAKIMGGVGAAAGGLSAGLSGQNEDPPLIYEENIVATWSLRRGNEWGEVKGRLNAPEVAISGRVVRPKTEFLANAELSTFSKLPSIVPNSIYLSHQFAFGTFVGDDYYALLRWGDLAVPSQEIKVRKEVVVRPGSNSAIGNEVDESEGFVGSPSSALIDITGGTAQPPGFTNSFTGLASLAGFGNMGGSGVPISNTPSSNHGHGGVRSSFDEGLAAAISANLSIDSSASPSRRVLPALPNGMPTAQMRHRGHDPRTLVDAGTKGVKELGRIGRELASKVGERTGGLNVTGLRSPRSKPLATPPTMLEFDEEDELFSVDGLELGAPITPATDSNSNVTIEATIRPAERPRVLSRPNLPGSFGESSRFVGGIIGLDTGPEVFHQAEGSGSSDSISLLAPPPRTPTPSVIPIAEEQDWVGKSEEYHEAIEEDARFDDVIAVFDEEVRERKEEEERRAAEEALGKKRVRGRKGKKR